MTQTRTQPSDQAEPAVADRARSYAWEDPALLAAAARRLPGNEFFAELTSEALPKPPIAETVGFTATFVRDGVARFELDPQEFHYNPIGTVHGGVIATLCDSACGCAVHSMLPAGAYYTSLDLTVKFLRPVTASTGRLMCEGTVLHLGSRSALAQAALSGPDGKLYAHATSSCMIFR
ncbi:MAG TPA: PaaI family thioesterase [Streptosporangiaceae bacterium]|nr:PaaI family thioesterase [Streptosporangiaceae bacterium]